MTQIELARGVAKDCRSTPGAGKVHEGIACLLESMAGKLEEIELFAASLLQKDAKRLRAILERP